jgi:hypothetical protein
MKNLSLLMTAGLFLLTACSKDESFEPMEEQTNDVVYVLDQNIDQAAFTTVAMDDFTSGVNFTRQTSSSGFAHTSGLYQPMYQDPVILSWFGNKDGHGFYGSAELQISRPNYNIHIIMQTECITVDGDMAVYGARITEVLELSGDTPPLTAEWRFYFQVIDNGRAKSPAFDQISNKWVFAYPRSQSLCIIPPTHRFWTANGYDNVQSPGFVEVSNYPE